MKETDTGQEKIKKICEALRKETLEPAIVKADQILQEAQEKAHLLVEEAKLCAEKLLEEAKRENEKQKGIYEASLRQTCKQTIDYLKQELEKNLFEPAIEKVAEQALAAPHTLAKLIEAVVKGLENEGISGDISVYISDHLPIKEVNGLVAKHVLERLREKSVLIAPIAAGAIVKLDDAGIRIDLTSSTLQEIMAKFLRKDLREMFFKADKK